jgi:peptide/nickel transport system substrate-binding protein
MIGTDMKAIGDALFIDGELHAYPMSSLTPYYTPLDELPESAQVLYSNDQELAKKMLTDAGYADGFKMKIHAHSVGAPESDIAMILMEMWEPLGIEVEVVVLEWPVIASMNAERTLEDAWCAGMVNTTPYIAFWALADPEVQDWFWSGYDDPVFLEPYRAALKINNVAERTEAIKKLSISWLEECAFIPFTGPYISTCYWPWVKNFYGELESGYYNWQVQSSLIWIDQDLKAELGY